MRQVKALMIARHVLAGLWLLVWLTASPGAHARAISSGDFAPAFAATDGQGEQHGNDLTDLRFQALRASRRCDSQTDPTDPPAGLSFFNAGISRHPDIFGPHVCSEASVGLASGWQFLLRTALSPRAPSFVS
jgi:hypothetical protein